jgi:hypothetical protein
MRFWKIFDFLIFDFLILMKRIIPNQEIKDQKIKDTIFFPAGTPVLPSRVLCRTP